MPQSFDVTWKINERVTFNSEPTVPDDLQGKTLTVIHSSILILNDFYFNNEVFTCYHLQDEQKNDFLVTPFRFEEDEVDKLRITRSLTQQEIDTLFPNGQSQSVFNVPTDPNEAETIVFDEKNIPASLKSWLGRSYYIDLKDHGVGSASYMDIDLKNKKNVNAESLLSKHSAERYTLFQGDYALYFIEANLQGSQALRVTLFLEENCLDLHK